MGSLLRGALLLIAVLVAMGCTDLLQTAQCMGAAAGGEILSRRSLAAAHAGSSMYSSNMARKLAGRHESKSTKNQQVLRTQLLHRDHPDSPLSRSSTSNTKLSHTERMAAAVKRSWARRDYISSRARLTREAGDFESQVTPDIGEYTMALSVGTPPQRFVAVMDTGSDLVWLNCLPCIQCINQPHGPPFDPSLSSSYSPASCVDNACTALPNNWGTCAGTNCGYQYEYGDGSSTEGELAYETFTVTNVDGSTTAIPNVTFGCGHNQTGNSFNGADGVAGMGQGQISLPSQFQNLFPDIFTYCLVSASSSSPTATVSSSTLLFGSPENTGAGISSLVYTPLLENLIFPTFYYVGMTGISVGGTLLTIPTTNFDIAVDGTGGVIFDSGTTYTLLTLDAYNAASQAVQSLITYPIISSPLEGLDLMCFDVTGVDPASNISVPTMVFHFQSSDASSTGGPATVDYVLDLENVYVYLERAALCLTILPTMNGLSIIGNSAQVDHQIVFDRVNNQIGWASTTC
ncbi:unnamed protein product [Sphagnum balticum]